MAQASTTQQKQPSYRIESKADFEYFLACDRIGLRIPEGSRRPRPVVDQVWEYEILLRKVEYHTNVRTPLGRMLLPYYKLRYHRLGAKLGLLIPPNVFGPGLSIAHFGCTIVSANARVGANCRIHEGVTLGADHGNSLAPQLGNNCFIGSGAKIIGDVHLGDNVAVGAGAVVTRSFPESDITLGGGSCQNHQPERLLGLRRGRHGGVRAGALAVRDATAPSGPVRAWCVIPALVPAGPAFARRGALAPLLLCSYMDRGCAYGET